MKENLPKQSNKKLKSLPFITEKYTHDIVTLRQAREWLRMDIPGYDGEDSVILMAIESAVSWVETYCNLSLGISDYEWNTDCLPNSFNDVFYIQSITSIDYRGESGYLGVNSNNYELIQVSKRRSEIEWFNTQISSNRYKIKFKAGFPDGQVPAVLLDAIRARIAERFENRGDGVSEKKTLSEKLADQFKIPYAG
ncbi:phage head-tail connector protein [Dyadobacter sp. CY345]|uniref:phage head-tail connector protein n=1 Tax=Dyadobacter sp. CY345 TaxID=2909335 RepID=UPI001F2EFE79|nr:phage head-tail connector protein [Dyadobacter sp. CY345]MCF2443649.1 phage head-tail connector protein [Dyadobacter sp. CY345]